MYRDCEKDNDVCTIFTILIIQHAYELLNVCHDLIVFTIIVFQNKREDNI